MLLASQSCSSHWDTRYWCFRFARKAHVPTIFLIIKVHLWNERNLDARNKLNSFCYGHYNHVLVIGLHDIDALDLQEKPFVPPFSLQSKFIRGIRQTWIPIINSIFFLIGTTIMSSSLGCTILMLWICKKKKAFFSFIFLIIKVHRGNESNLDTRNNLISFC